MSSALERIRDVYQRRLQFRDEDVMVIDAFISAVLACYHPDTWEALWLFICAAGSSGKTELVSGLEGYEWMHFLSTVTDNALASGATDDKGNDCSLLPKINGKVMTMKDLSGLEGQDSKLIHKFFGELRDAFDGSFNKASGTRGTVHYESRFGFIACVTEVLDGFLMRFQQLGPRFLIFRLMRELPTMKQRDEMALRGIDSTVDKKQWKQEIKDVVQEEVDKLRTDVMTNPFLPAQSAAIKNKTGVLANLLSLLRSGPSEGTAGNPELPFRAVQQLINIGHTHVIADGRRRWNEEDVKLIVRLAVDSLPKSYRKFLQCLYSTGEYRPGTSAKCITAAASISPRLVKLIAMQYRYAGVIEVESDAKDHSRDIFRLTEDAYSRMRYTQLFGSAVQDTKDITETIKELAYEEQIEQENENGNNHNG